jgi:ABC-type sugar transport system substrate-binding protein
MHFRVSMKGTKRRLIPVLGVALVAAVAVTTAAALTVSNRFGPSMTNSLYSPGGALPKAPSLKGKTICYIKEGDVPYFNDHVLGAKLAVTALGGKFVTLNSNFKPATELANVQDCITQNVDGILLFSISEGTLESSSRLAKRAGIPVVDFYGQGPGIEKDLVSAWVGGDSYGQVGLPLGKALAKLIPKGAPVAQIEGLRGRYDVIGYTTGFKNAMKQSDHKIVASPTSNWSRSEAFTQMGLILQKYPHIAGVFCQNDDTTAGCVRALQQAGYKPEQVKMVTCNNSPTGISLVKQGWLQVDACWSPSEESTIGTHLLALLLKNPNASLPIPCHPPSVIVTKKSLAGAPPWHPTAALVRKWLKVGCAAG